jgi:hypothetical protein
VSHEAQLIAAIAAIWGVLVTVCTAGFRWLLSEMKRRDVAWEQRLTAEEKQCSQRVTRLEAKLDEATDIIHRQADSQQQQIEAQAQMIGTLQELARGPLA